METFVFHGEWISQMKNLDSKTQDKVIADIARYGSGLEPIYTDDPVVSTFVNMIKGRIDFSKDKYNEKVESGSTFGRKKKVDDKIVWEMAQKGMTAAAIADKLGCSKTSIDHCEGWKNRKMPFYNKIL